VKLVMALVSWLMVVQSADIAVVMFARTSVAALFSALRALSVSIAAFTPW
jgi:hypothetical protein